MIPQVKLTKQNGGTGVVRPTDEGILAIIAASSTGTQNQPASYTRPEDVVTDRGYGRLASFSAHALAVAQNPIVAVTPATSTPGAYGSITQAGTGSTVASGDATVKPYDTWNVLITCVVGGTIGSASPAITFTTSVDGGVTTSAVQALGTATFIQIANTGVKVNLTVATWVAGDTIAFTTTPPYATTTDLTASLECLRTTSLPYDTVLVDCTASSTVIAQLDTWLALLEGVGIYRSAIVNFRMKNAGESEASYQTAIQTLMTGVATDRVVVCADGGDMVDYFQAVKVPRPTSLYTAAQGEANDIAIDPAYVALGPLENCTLTDTRGNPKYHDEQIYPGIDALQVTTLRSFPRQQGAFITNARLGSSTTSDYQFWQQLRVMNKACEIAYLALTQALSIGVAKSSKVGPAGQRYIAEQDAAKIEAVVMAALTNPLKNRVTDYLFTLSRTDDISSNAGAKINATLQIVPLAYVKEFDVKAGFTKTIVAPLAA
jgi:hypothetical protein